MKTAHVISVSPVGAVYFDITDSACLTAKYENPQNGDISTGGGPTPVKLLERLSRRKVGRVKRFIEENETTNERSTPDYASTSNSQPQRQQTSPSQLQK